MLDSLWIGTLLTLLPWGLLADRFGERLVLGTGLGACGIATAAAGSAHTFKSLVLLVGLAGAAGASVNAASGRAVMQWFPASERGFALGVRQTAIPVGGLISSGSACTQPAGRVRLPRRALSGGRGVRGGGDPRPQGRCRGRGARAAWARRHVARPPALASVRRQQLLPRRAAGLDQLHGPLPPRRARALGRRRGRRAGSGAGHRSGDADRRRPLVGPDRSPPAPAAGGRRGECGDALGRDGDALGPTYAADSRVRPGRRDLDGLERALVHRCGRDRRPQPQRRRARDAQSALAAAGAIVPPAFAAVVAATRGGSASPAQPSSRLRACCCCDRCGLRLWACACWSGSTGCTRSAAGRARTASAARTGRTRRTSSLPAGCARPGSRSRSTRPGTCSDGCGAGDRSCPRSGRARTSTRYQTAAASTARSGSSAAWRRSSGSASVSGRWS